MRLPPGPRPVAAAAALLAALLLGLPSGVRAQPAAGASPSEAAPETTAIRDVRVFDGREVVGSATVVFRGDRISAVGPDVAVPDGASVVDGEGRTLLPGLVDAHVHTFDPAHLRSALAFGVTTVLDMFTQPRLAEGWEEEQAAGEAHGRADLYSAGVLATAPGGHGTQFGLQIPTVESPDDAGAFVEARIEEGSDWIKIVYDDGGLYGLDFPTLDEPTLDALAEAAHARDRLAVVHVSTLSAARDVVDAGADGLAHVWADSVPDRSFGRAMADRGMFVVPTLSVTRSTTGTPGGAPLVEDERLTPYLTSSARGQLTESYSSRPESRVSYEAARASVEALAEAGVRILAGTDAPNPGTAHGVSMHGELELLVEAGLSPVEALRAATSAPARTFGLEERGRIEPGLRADLLLVEGDPTSDVTRTRAIAGVWKGGVRFDREAFRQEIAAQEQRAAAPATAGPEPGTTISDFDGGEASAAFGVGWSTTSDRMMGGSSTASLEVVEGGAEGTSHALRIQGEIAGDVGFPWGGAMLFPGERQMSPVDLSSSGGLRFRARGDGKSYRVMLFTEASGRRPLTVSFPAGESWRLHEFPWSAFGGSDGSGVTGVAVVGGPEAGAYRLSIDEVKLME